MAKLAEGSFPTLLGFLRGMGLIQGWVQSDQKN